MGEPLIAINNLYFSYSPGCYCLKNLSLALFPGECLGILGANGSGKSTLLRLIMGLMRPEKGLIRIFDSERKEEKDFIEIRRRIGLLFQDADDQLFCPTVLEDIAFGPLNLGKSANEAKEIALTMLDALGLQGFADKITYQLSGGEKRLVALATILAMEPEVLLLDEPTNGLDQKAKELVIHLLARLKKSMIIISHDQEFYKKLVTRALYLEAGTIADKFHAHEHVHIHTHTHTHPHAHEHPLNEGESVHEHFHTD